MVLSYWYLVLFMFVSPQRDENAAQSIDRHHREEIPSNTTQPDPNPPDPVPPLVANRNASCVCQSLGLSEYSEVLANPPPGIDELVALSRVLKLARSEE